jgi:hypothetical protein
MDRFRRQNRPKSAYKAKLEDKFGRQICYKISQFTAVRNHAAKTIIGALKMAF